MTTTLIKAFCNHDKSTPQSISLLACVHKDGLDIKTALGTAFRRWYTTTPEGEDYVDENGNNWGDAFEIPDSFLREQGINAYWDAELPNGDKKRLDLKFDLEIIVDSDEELFDIGEADEEIP